MRLELKLLALSSLENFLNNGNGGSSSNRTIDCMTDLEQIVEHGGIKITF